jgi:CheY-like chemotaxis protein
VSESSHESDGPSRDELRELLGDVLGSIEEELNTGETRAAGDSLVDSPEPSGPARVLLVSRRDSDSRLLSSRLEALGTTVEVVRNAFAALDKLRTGVYEAVISDLNLWANNGGLLLERIESMGVHLPVLFLVERAADGGPRELGFPAGDPDFLRCPLFPAEMERGLARLLADGLERKSNGDGDDSGLVAGDRDDVLPVELEAPGVREDGPEDVLTSIDESRARQALVDDGVLDRALVDEALEKAPASGSLEEGRFTGTGPLTGELEDEGAQVEGGAAGFYETPEVGWLRFLVKGHRLLHEEPRELGPLARLALEELGALAVGLFVDEGGRTSASLESQAGTESLLFKRILDANRGKVSDGQTVVVEVPGSRLVLLGLSPQAQEAGRAYLEDLRLLLEDW